MQTSLFESKTDKTNLLPCDGEAFYFENFLPDHQEIFENLKQTIDWSQDEIFVYGKKHLIPRLQAWYGDPHCSYTYSGLNMSPRKWLPALSDLRSRVSMQAGVDFNCVLCNFYRDGKDYVSWHADDEAELGAKPVIASLSLGEIRSLHFKHRSNKGIEKIKLDMASGSLLIMKGETQRYWHHQIAKTTRAIGGRINLTFRRMEK
jgi:alkylated DNA repair dioxygenase AlkB